MACRYAHDNASEQPAPHPSTYKSGPPLGLQQYPIHTANNHPGPPLYITSEMSHIQHKGETKKGEYHMNATSQTPP